MAKFQHSSKPKNEVPETKVSFSWDGYIDGSEDKPAPKACFKQSIDPPTNEFKPGMKLESRDPRNSMSFCVATVIYTSGPRLCLRLDGSDNRNDFWSLADSEDIHPYGWCEEQGDQLQPPLGFAKNASYYPVFLNKLLQESKDNMADKKCFKPVPSGPTKNLFEVGMKLEAIDRKNPYLIAPATIGELDGDKVYIQFDGWRGAFDYWCRYDSRDIFPVGWCAAVGHILQFPGTKGNIPRARGSSSSKSQSVSPNIAVHIDTQLPAGHAVPAASVGEPSPGSARSVGSKRNSPAVNKLLSPDLSISPAAAAGETVTAYVNQTCRCGPMLNQTRIIRLPLHYGPGVVSRTLKKIIQALVDSAVNPAQVFNNIVTAPSNCNITAKITGKLSTCTIPLVTTESAFLDYISNFLQRIECCENLITLEPLRQLCDKCSVTTSLSNHSLKRAYSTNDGNLSSVRGRRGRPLRALSVPGRGRGKRRKTSLRQEYKITSPPAPPPLQSPKIEPFTQLTSPTPSNSSVNPDISVNPYDWTSDDVVIYVRGKDPTLSKQAHLIKKHEIDGRAFLLMTSDIAIKYMQMKVGPALKMCSVIDQLRLSMRY